MNKTKWTKGEWVNRGCEVGVIDDSDTQSYGMLLTICYLDECCFTEWKDNGNLIATAPELYDKLEGVLNLLEQGYPYDSLLTELENEIFSIRESLAKARGEL